MTTDTSTPPAAEAVLSFWFGPLGPDGRPDEMHRKRWFVKDDAFDAELRERFMTTHEAVVAREHDDWLASPRGRLAYVIVLDQFSRNMFRGTVGMFVHDLRARDAAVEGLEAGQDQHLAPFERQFLYMPLMHAENLDDQERCLALFRKMRDEAPEAAREGAEQTVKFAIMHRDIIARFGRFPHRNAILGRSSTPIEDKFLEQPGSSF